MSNISKRRREGSRSKIKCVITCSPIIQSMGDHQEFLKRITKTLYYGELPSIPCLSLPVTEVSCALWSAAQQGRSLRRLHGDAAARLAYDARVSPCALVLALLYLERLRLRNPAYLAATAPADLFLVSLMVGNKFLQDDGEDAETLLAEWAAAGGLPLQHLKRLEIDFLDAMEWNVYVNDETFESGLSRLERHVALKQARARGFFTYGELAAAGAGAGASELLAAGAAAAALALAYVAALSALLTSAVLVSYLPLLQLSTSTHTQLATHTSPTDLNSTVEFTPPRCCTDWLRYQATINPEQVDWSSSINLPDAWLVDSWSISKADLTWGSSLVDPVQRWLGKLDEYADNLFQPDGRGCARRRLELSKFGGLMVMSDR